MVRLVALLWALIGNVPDLLIANKLLLPNLLLLIWDRQGQTPSLLTIPQVPLDSHAAVICQVLR